MTRPLPALALLLAVGCGGTRLAEPDPPPFPGFGFDMAAFNGGGGDQGWVRLAPLPEPAFRTPPSCLAAADLDGDRRVDLVVSSARDGAVSILIGRGDGTFVEQERVSTAAGPDGCAIADLDGDGAPDIVVAHPAGGTVETLLNAGDGRLRDGHPLLAVGAQPNAVVVGDFDRDGRADLAVACAGAGFVGIARGRGDGTFGAPQRVTVPNPASLAAADFNRDGRLDLACSSPWGTSTLHVLLALPGGGFRPTEVVGSTELTDLLAGDLTGDGVPDLTVGLARSPAVWTLPGSGNGSFGAPRIAQLVGRANHLAVGDLDGDGRLDLAVANDADTVEALHGVAGYLQDEVRASVGSGKTLGQVVIADVDNNGAPDVVVGSSGGYRVLANR